MHSTATLIIHAPTWVGDCVMATPALAAFRRGFPDARIILLAKAYAADVFEGGPWFDELVRLPPRGAPRRRRRTLAIAHDLRRRRADLGVLLPNSFSSAWLMWLARPRKILGYSRDARRLFLTVPVAPPRRGRRFEPAPMVDYYLKLAEVAGCPAIDRHFRLATTRADEAACDALFADLDLAGDAPLVALSPGAAFGAAKCWPPGHFAALARRFAERDGFQVLVLCSPNEADMARAIVTEADHPAVKDVHDRPMALGTAKAVVKRLALLVTNDSGLRHFGAAFDVPTVTLFGPTDERWSQTGHPDEIIIKRDVPCRPCQRRVCPTDHACMTSITPDEVHKAARGLLERKR